MCIDDMYQSMMFVERAAEKPSMLKLISVAVQRASPAITGNRDKFTQRPVDQNTQRAVNGCVQMHAMMIICYVPESQLCH